MVSIKTIAREAGVSVSTASKALNGRKDVSAATRERVMEVAERLGYTPNPIARRLSAKRKNLIGLLILHTDTLEIGGSIFIKILGEIGREAAARGYDILLMTPAQGKSYMELARRSRVDGLIILGLTLEDDNLDELRETELPMAILDQRVEGKYSVATDSREGIGEIMKYLTDTGHNEVVFAGYCPDSQVSEDRYGAYLDYLSPFQGRVYRGGFSYEDGFDMGRRIASDIRYGEKIEAVVCASDMVALGVIRELQRAGIGVPEDVSVSGFDDLLPGRISTPALTTISQDTVEISKNLLQGVVDLVEGGRVEEKVVRGRLIIRDSVGGRDEREDKK